MGGLRGSSFRGRCRVGRYLDVISLVISLDRVDRIEHRDVQDRVVTRAKQPRRGRYVGLKNLIPLYDYLGVIGHGRLDGGGRQAEDGDRKDRQPPTVLQRAHFHSPRSSCCSNRYKRLSRQIARTAVRRGSLPGAPPIAVLWFLRFVIRITAGRNSLFQREQRAPAPWPIHVVHCADRRLS